MRSHNQNIHTTTENFVNYQNKIFNNSRVNGKIESVYQAETLYTENNQAMGFSPGDKITRLEFLEKHRTLLSSYSEGRNIDKRVTKDQGENYNLHHSWNMHLIRDEYQADLVVLFTTVKGVVTKNGNSYAACGIGPQTWDNQDGSPSFDSEKKAYVVIFVGDECYNKPTKTEHRRWLFTHEMGHAFGLRHDQFTDKLTNFSAQKDNANFGYINKKGGYFTMMSYYGTCVERSKKTCTLIESYSSDRPYYNKGKMLKIGDKYHNSSHKLDQFLKVVANYRNDEIHYHHEFGQFLTTPN